MKKTCSIPTVSCETNDSNLYSFAMIDCDYPVDSSGKLSDHILWFISNIPGGSIDISKGSELLPFIPPHPQRGTGFHRFLSVLMRQESSVSSTDMAR